MDELNKNEVIIDFEGDGFKPTKIHVFSYKINNDPIKSTVDPAEIASVLCNKDNYIIGHNIIRFDIPNLERLLKIKCLAKPIDTLPISWYLYPQQKLHGLEDWGEALGTPKPEISDWFNLSFEEYKHRCEEDVKINTQLWDKFKNRLAEIYTYKDHAYRFLDYLMFKMHCAKLAEESKWKLDIERTKRNLQTLGEIREVKFRELQQALPKVPIKQVKERPAKLYKKDGTATAIGEKWFELLRQTNKPLDYNEGIEVVISYEDSNPNSHHQVKDWLFSLGWKPQTFKQNKKKEEIPQINHSDPDKKGELCPSVLELVEKEPAIDSLAGYFVLNHRISLLEGFLKNVDEDGYVSAQVAGLTNTLRFKHKVIVNLPGVNKPYGEYIRPVLIAPDGYKLCGSDMSSLEDRTKQHFMWDYDSAYVKEMTTPGFDPHLDIALASKMMTQEQVDTYKALKKAKEKTPPHLDVIRHNAKTTNYSCTYGAYPPKIAKSAKISLEEAKELWDAYWERNWSIKSIAENVGVKPLKDGTKWLYNPVSTFYYSLRSDKDRFSTLNQGTGAYCFDVWVGFVINKRQQLTAQFHDEIVLTIMEGTEEQTEKLLKESIIEANKFLKLNRELDVGVQFGYNYGEIH